MQARKFPALKSLMEKVDQNPEYGNQLSQLLSERMGSPKVDLSRLTSTQKNVRNEMGGMLAHPSVENFFRETRTIFDTPADAFRKEFSQYDKQMQLQKLDSMATGFQFCGMIGAQFNKKFLQQAGAVGESWTRIQAGVLGLQGLTAASPAALFAGPVGMIGMAALTIFSIFSKKKSKEDPFPLILMQHLQAISNQIQNMHTDMHHLFETSFENQHLIFKTIVQGFKQLKEFIHEEMSELKIPLIQSLDSLHATMNRLFDLVKYSFDSTMLLDLKNLLNKSERCIAGEEKVDDGIIASQYGKLCDWLKKTEGRASHKLHTGAVLIDGLAEGDPNELICKILNSSNSFSELMGFFAKHAELSGVKLQIPEEKFHEFIESTTESKSELADSQASSPLSLSAESTVLEEKHHPSDSQQLKVDTGAVFNPTIWGKAAIRLIELRTSFDEIIRKYDPVNRNLDSVIQSGENMMLFYLSLISPDLFNKLFDDYASALSVYKKVFDDAISIQSSKVSSFVDSLYPPEAKERRPELNIAHATSINISASQMPLNAPLKEDLNPFIIPYKIYFFKIRDSRIRIASFVLPQMNFKFGSIDSDTLRQKIPKELILMVCQGLASFEVIYKAYISPWTENTVGWIEARIDYIKKSNRHTILNTKYRMRGVKSTGTHWEGDTTNIVTHICIDHQTGPSGICNLYYTATSNLAAVLKMIWDHKILETVTEPNPDLNARLCAEAKTHLNQYFLTCRKEAVASVLDNVAIRAALKSTDYKLDANLRLLRAYAHLCGFTDGLEWLNKLPNSTQVIQHFEGFLKEESTIETTISNTNLAPELSEIREKFLHKITECNPVNFKSSFLTEITDLLVWLKLIRYKPVALNPLISQDEKAHATESAEAIHSTSTNLRPDEFQSIVAEFQFHYKKMGELMTRLQKMNTSRITTEAKTSVVIPGTFFNTLSGLDTPTLYGPASHTY